MASFDDKIIKIEQALENTDFQVLSNLIHQLAGSSGSYGFIELSDYCSLVEQQLSTSTDPTKDLSPTIAQLISLMKAASRSH